MGAQTNPSGHGKLALSRKKEKRMISSEFKDQGSLISTLRLSVSQHLRTAQKAPGTVTQAQSGGQDPEP